MKPKEVKMDSAITHVTGKSLFIDDIPEVRGELHVGIVTSKVAKGRVVEIQGEAALAEDGVVGFFTAKDLVNNCWGPIVADQPLLVENDVEYFGEAVALVAAESRESLRRGLAAVAVKYESRESTLTIEQAISNSEFLHESQSIECGEIDSAFSKAYKILEGEFRSGGQDHFYLESQACIAYPKEQGDIEVISSSQHPTELQHVTAKALGLRHHQVVCKVYRMGGAFGGKESQSSHVGALAALVAQKLGRPARLVLDKDLDMVMTGKRHPYLTKYKVAINSEGVLQGLIADYYADGGAYIDLSPAILQRTLLHADNAYYLPAVKIKGVICKTNLAPNTAFRGFGGPQAAAVIEHIMEEIALEISEDSLDVRLKNCYRAGHGLTTHYGQDVENNLLPQLFEQLEKECEYRKRRKEIAQEQGKNKQGEILRGLSMTACKFGISFTSRFLNQGSAQVNVHLDGSVQVSTGATEMGQGVNTKIALIVAEAFGISQTDVRMMVTSTEKNHNTSATAASSGADINGSAALQACEKIKSRMASIALQIFAGKVSKPDQELEVDQAQGTSEVVFADGWIFSQKNKVQKISWGDLISHMYMNRISLGEYAHYRTAGIGYDKDKGVGTPFLYFTNGVAASEVSINRFTGEVKVLRTDILMDLGRPIHHGIDEGQVAGAFVQAQGWVVSENLSYRDGELLSHSPTTYKIPNIQDTPREFNISFISNESNVANVRKSKAVGEPPFLLGLSVWTAIKNGLSKTTDSREKARSFARLPATNEEIIGYLWDRSDC